ncbi:MAG: hypothetical protein ACREIO_04265, partial [Nitrospiraceae bacterium]
RILALVVCGRLLLVTLALLLPGCALQRPLSPEPPPHFARECAPPPVPVLPSPATPAPPIERPESGQLEAFSPRFHRIAAAVGLLPLLRESVALERESAAKKEGAAVELVRVRQQIVARTLLAMLEATSLAGVVRCEQARADELADSLAENQANSVQLATLVSVIIESATIIATGGLVLAGHEVAEGIAALVGGTMAAAVAGVSLYQPGRHDFQHPRNLLKEIWENPQPAQYFPGPVWQFLSEPTEDGKSLREQLVASWKELSRIEGQTEDQQRQRINLLFGTGGTYTIEDLRSRAAMLEMLAAAIDLMHDELEVLVREMLVREELKQ